ncbi:MAG: lipoprotein [Pseudomonadota bacterium]
MNAILELQRTIAIPAAFSLLGLLAACGQTGPLTLPAKPVPAVSPSQTTVPPAPAQAPAVSPTPVSK